MTITHAPEPRSAIEAAGNLPDLELDIATVALQLARVDAPEADWRKVAAHFSDIARKVVDAASIEGRAEQVLAKHDENYMAPEAAAALAAARKP